MVDCLTDEFDLRMDTAPCDVDYFSGSNVYTAYPKSKHLIMTEKRMLTNEPLFSFVPPTSGMFIWVRLAPTESHHGF
jgi:aromatic amino acid aminotransferase I